MMPTVAASNEASRIPSLASLSKSVPGKARPPMKRAMVKPIPARNAVPTTCRHDTPSGSVANPALTANQLATPTPNGLPITRPAIMPSGTDEASVCIADASILTPALNSANTGKMA